MTYHFDFGSVLEYWPMFLQGALTTLVMSFWSTIAGFIMGVLCAIARSSNINWLRKAVGTYVEEIRNTPLIIQSYCFIFGLSSIGFVRKRRLGTLL